MAQDNLHEITRYLINGLVATGVHFAVLMVNMSLLSFQSAALANLIAACFGISASFLGSRYFVFHGHHQAIVPQAIRFSGLYGLIALLHGAVLLVWTDWLDFSYQTGFVLATGLQVGLSYFGNKLLIFRI